VGAVKKKSFMGTNCLYFRGWQVTMKSTKIESFENKYPYCNKNDNGMLIKC